MTKSISDLGTTAASERAKIFWASGSKGKEVRADGNRGFLARGYYYKKPGYALGVVLAGPYRTRTQAQADLIRELA